MSVPRALLEMKPVFLSILGAPASGKSYFLASMTWRLRQLLPRQFALNFGDADPVGTVEALALNAEERHMILRGNAARLLGL